MKSHLGLKGAFAVALLGLAATAGAQQILVNEYTVSGTDFGAASGGDVIELVLLRDFLGTELNSYFVGDSQAAKNTKQAGWQFQAMETIAGNFRRGTIIVVGGGAAVPADDTSYNPDNGDWTIHLQTANATDTPYLDAFGSSPNIATGDIVWVDNVGVGATITPNVGFAVEHGTAAVGSFNSAPASPIQTGPSVDLGAVTSGNTVALETNFSGAYASFNWNRTATPTIGEPNGGENSRWIDSLRGAQVASDNAGNTAYSAGSFPNGSNGGTGFGGPWAITPPTNNANRGAFAGDSGSNGSGVGAYPVWDINNVNNNQSWGLYSNGGVGVTEAIRPFASALQEDQEFRISFDNGFLDAGSSVGFGLRNASNENLFEFYFAGGGTTYTVSDGGGTFDTGIGFTDQGMDIVVKNLGLGSYRLIVTQRGTTTATFNRTLSSPAGGQDITSLRLFNFNAGNSGLQNVYYNAIGIDDPRPLAVSLERADADPNNLGSVDFLMTFNEDVTGVTAANFSLTATGSISGASVGTVTGGPRIWTVPVNTGTGDGTIEITLANNTGIADGHGNRLRGLPFVGDTYTIDKTAPSSSIVIDAGATYNTSGLAALALSADDGSGSGIGQVRYSNDGVAWSAPAPFMATESWILDTGTEGLKTVYYEVSDLAGNTATPSTDTIILDFTAPSGSVSTMDTTLAGTVTFEFASADATSGVSTNTLWVRVPGSGVFTDTGVTEPGTTGTISYTPTADGVHDFALRVTDFAGISSAPPTTGDIFARINDVPNSSYPNTFVADGTQIFPMTNDLDVEIFIGGFGGGSEVFTVSRSTSITPPAGLNAADLLQESLTITGNVNGGTAQVTWNFDPASAAGLTDPLDTVFQVSGGVVVNEYMVTPDANPIVINGITSFSEWYAGSANASSVADWTVLLD